MRAISTVLDVSLFLLLVGAAVATVTLSFAPPVDTPDDGSDPADETVETLATSTARVNYSVGPDLARVEPAAVVDVHSPILDRSDHGSYAELLGEAAVAIATIDGDRLTVGGQAFESAATNATERVIRREGVGTSVRAHWSPYPDAFIHGGVRAGDHPPRDVDVRTATVVVDSGLTDGRKAAIDAAHRDGFAGVATVLADATVEGLFPARESRVAVRGDSPTVELAAARYERAEDALDVSIPDVRRGYVTPANDELRSTFRERFVADLRANYDEPSVAARDVAIGEVTVVVRTWSR